MKVCPRCSKLQPDDATHCPRDSSELRSVLDPLIGKTVGGRHRLLSRIGTGGMSSVYLAKHVLIERLMAIKTLRRDLARDPVQRDRFLREARAVNRINHENIVEITDFGETEDGLVYLVMEYVPGDSLLKVLSSAPLSTARALAIAEQVGSALGRAHQMGVIHRDLKPENILLVTQGSKKDFVKILDFGIAKIVDAPSLTGSQQIFGTPGYIAPEYIESTDIDGRADLYSLGIILYEMVTGALPFDYEFPGDLLVKHVTEPPIPPRSRHPDVDPAVEELILQCLRKAPADRFRDAYHFLDEIRGVQERIGAVPAGVFDEAAAAMSIRDTLVDGIDEELLASETPGEGATPPRRQPTRAYGSPSIPEPPPSLESLPVPIEVEIDTGDRTSGRPPSQQIQPDPVRYGLLGVSRWRERFDAIRTALDDIEIREPAPAEIALAMAFVSQTLERFEGGVAQCEADQRRIDEIDGEARALRSALGRQIDDVARQLSKVRGDFERLVAHRNDLRDAREGALRRSRTEQAGESRADVMLWELGAVDEEIGQKGSRCDELEVQLAELRELLEKRSARTAPWWCSRAKPRRCASPSPRPSASSAPTGRAAARARTRPRRNRELRAAAKARAEKVPLPPR